MKEDYDIFKDSWLRYLGYTNEVGESFRYQFPKLVKPSYAIASLYVLSDAIDKAYKHKQLSNSNLKIGYAFIDTLIWQSLASVLVPGFTIFQIVRFSRLFVT
jgi:mitochondrial fission process protein 1